MPDRSAITDSLIRIPSIGESLSQRPRWLIALAGIVIALVASVASFTLLIMGVQGTAPDWAASDGAGAAITATALLASIGGSFLYGLFWTRALAPVRVRALEAAFPGARVWVNSMSYGEKVFLKQATPISRRDFSRLKWNNYVVVLKDEIAFWQTGKSSLVKVGFIARDTAISVALASIPYMGNPAAGLKVTIRSADGLTSAVPLIPSEFRIFPRSEFPSEVRAILEQWMTDGRKQTAG